MIFKSYLEQKWQQHKNGSRISSYALAQLGRVHETYL